MVLQAVSSERREGRKEGRKAGRKFFSPGLRMCFGYVILGGSCFHTLVNGGIYMPPKTVSRYAYVHPARRKGMSNFDIFNVSKLTTFDDTIPKTNLEAIGAGLAQRPLVSDRARFSRNKS